MAQVIIALRRTAVSFAATGTIVSDWLRMSCAACLAQAAIVARPPPEGTEQTAEAGQDGGDTEQERSIDDDHCDLLSDPACSIFVLM